MLKNIRHILLLSLLLIACGLQAQNLAPTARGQVMEHTFYSLSYIEEHEQPEWVYYHLTPELTSGAADRTDDFREDKSIRTGSATLNDYKGSGYDRGHLCPAGSMSKNHTSMSESFFMSNMSPQTPSFNRGGWKQLEERVREWVAIHGELHIVTGPIFKDNIGTIGANEVTIPGYYYKAIYAPRSGIMIGFIMPNQKLTKPTEGYIVSIDSLETTTGIDLFPQLDDKLERELESQTSTLTQLSESKASDSTSNQCQATTQGGKRCSRKASAGSRFCWQHQK